MHDPMPWDALLLPLVLLLPAALPAPLGCLHDYYGVHVDAAGVTLVDGTRLPYDDGRDKSFAERLAHPDVLDTFTPPYPTGPITPVTTPDADPGRARLDALLATVYPRAGLVHVPFVGTTIVVHARVAPAFARVAARLDAILAREPHLRRLVLPLGGTLNVRSVAGTDRQSAHSWGIAIDLNPAPSHYWRWDKSAWRNQLPQSIVDAFEAEGFIWGGRWAHFDTMHFEYRPELIDPRCRPPSAKRGESADTARITPPPSTPAP